MSRLPSIISFALISATLTWAAGCASSPSTSSTDPNTPTPASEPQPNAIVHQVDPNDTAATHSKYPLSADTATLWVNGLSCPQCASNVDVQLLRVNGISKVKVDLSTGKIAIAMNGPKRPSPAQLSRAVEDAGFTLAKIETP